MLAERGPQPEVTGGGKAVEPNDLAFQVGDRFDRGLRLRVVGSAEPARAFAADRRDDLGGHALRGGEDDAVRAARGKIDGIGFEGLGALVRALEFGSVNRVELALMPAQFGLGDQQPERLFRRSAIADAQRHRRGACVPWHRAAAEHARRCSAAQHCPPADCAHIRLVRMHVCARIPASPSFISSVRLRHCAAAVRVPERACPGSCLPPSPQS